MPFQTFYSEIGKLMYSIARADGIVTSTEYQKLRDIVRQKLVPQEPNTDQFGTDAAYYAEIEFDILLDQKPSTESCLDSFIGYVLMHHESLDDLHKSMLKKLLDEIASVYKGSHTKEIAMLKDLKKQLKTIFED